MLFPINDKPRIWLFCSDEFTSIENLLKKVNTWHIKAQVVTIVSDNTDWGIMQEVENTWMWDILQDANNFPEGDPYGEDLCVTFEFVKFYDNIIKANQLDYVFLSHWIKNVIWVNPRIIVNTHLWPIEQAYVWEDMHWNKLYEKILEDYKAWVINQTCITFHYVTDIEEISPIIAQIPVSLVWCESISDVKQRIYNIESENQWRVAELIVSGKIVWDWRLSREVVVYNEFIDKSEFPNGTVFAWRINLQEWTPFVSK